MPETVLPPAPDFVAIESSLDESMTQRIAVTSAIGNLLVNWGNNEGMLLHIFRLLLQTSLESAHIVWGTTNTTQTRVNLINRLAIQNTEGDIRRRILKMTDRFTKLTKTRNEVAHSMWMYTDKTYFDTSWSIHLTTSQKQNDYIKYKKIDQARINEIKGVTKELVDFNRSIWKFLPDLEVYMQKPLEERQETRPI